MWVQCCVPAARVTQRAHDVEMTSYRHFDVTYTLCQVARKPNTQSVRTVSERPWVLVPFGPRFFSSTVTFGDQFGFAARASSIRNCMSRGISVVPSRFGDEFK